MDFNLKNNKLWFGLAFVLALAVRLLRLGEMPLSDAEAAWAMQAFDLSRGLPLGFGPQPGYINLTAIFFFVLQSSNLVARLVPALAGSLLVLAPALFRDRLGEKAALVLAFLLAFEPGLLALSRQAGSSILAISLVMLAWGAWRNHSIRLAGFLAGLALLSGSALWVGLLGLALAFGLLRLVVPAVLIEFDQQRVRQALYFAAGTYLVFGSLFLLAPGGLGAGLASLPDFLTGLAGSDGAPFWLLPAALFFYQLPALVLALVSLARLFQRRDPLVIFLGLWLAASLLLAMLPQARQVVDLGWALLPLWTLASLEVVRWFRPIESIIELRPEKQPAPFDLAKIESVEFPAPEDEQPAEDELHPVSVSSGVWETIGMALLTFILVTFSWLNFMGVALVTFDPATIQIRWLVTIGALVLLALSVLLVAFGWSSRVAVQGFAWGVLPALAIYSLAMASFSANLRPAPTVEMWSVAPQSPAIGVIHSQASEISLLARGADEALSVSLVGINSPALRWLLREWRLSSSQALSLESNPDIIIMSGQALPPELEFTYRGAIFPWRAYPAWDQASASEWLRWTVRHELPQGYETILFWARTDLFPDAQNLVP